MSSEGPDLLNLPLNSYCDGIIGVSWKVNDGTYLEGMGDWEHALE